MWDAKSGAEVAILRGHSNWVNACAYSPDGCSIISGSSDHTLKIWDAESGAEVATLQGHSSWINACAYSPDGRRIVSGSSDNALKIRDAESGVEICTFVPNGHVKALALNPGGTDIFAGDWGGMVYLLRLKGLNPGPVIIAPWRLPTDDTQAFGCVHCRVWSEIPASAIGTGLPCPNCGKPVRLNPFTINADWRPIAKAWQGKL